MIPPAPWLAAVSKRTRGRKSPAPPYRLRIIGGRWRGVRIDFPRVEAIRPSPDRVRETLFNWLQPGSSVRRCLDLFAGSGALGLEALSRGAAQVTFVDREPKVGRHLTQTLERLKRSDADVHVADALRFLARAPAAVRHRVSRSAVRLRRCCSKRVARLGAGWLAPGAHVYLESPADQAVAAAARRLVRAPDQAGGTGRLSSAAQRRSQSQEDPS